MNQGNIHNLTKHADHTRTWRSATYQRSRTRSSTSGAGGPMVVGKSPGRPRGTITSGKSW
eukprot:CAMPEP_0204274660 /NCGR_PEP_ID=MMETSP0468-20130131/25317_1 /ASSEMBLY_ACC=CAM_ASM_000383 /TAXON_ID=2969 /ORGANISM="Oxyrrhis marina" /LENGTH=59 /DNA_ID=CAMNT_0051250903 /DNA_START=13 /DNA_END=189 /DNA_ORIENTATION=-